MIVNMKAAEREAMPIASCFARWISRTSLDSIPENVRSTVKLALFDTISCALFGYATPWAEHARHWALRGAAGTGEALVWGTQSRVRTHIAAFANGVAAHGFELDDYHHTKVHMGAVVVPAALAVAERIGASGAAFLAALVVGYEVLIRTAMALDPVIARGRGWHLTGVCGSLGAAAACASVLRLEPERIAWTLGLAGTQSAGLYAFNADGSMTKRFHAGAAAQSGVCAAELASEGFTGPAAIYEAEDGGLLHAFSDKPHQELLTKDLGETYYAGQVAIKPYSCCASIHPYIDAARQLRAASDFNFGRITKVQAGIASAVRLQCGFPYVPSTAMHAQMNLRFCIALALRDGTVLPNQFTERDLHAPELLSLIDNIDLVNDARLDRLYPEQRAAWLSVSTGGAEQRMDVDHPLGVPENPLGVEGVSEKVRALLEAAEQFERYAALERAIARLEERPVRELLSVLSF